MKVVEKRTEERKGRAKGKRESTFNAQDPVSRFFDQDWIFQIIVQLY